MTLLWFSKEGHVGLRRLQHLLLLAECWQNAATNDQILDNVYHWAQVRKQRQSLTEDIFGHFFVVSFFSISCSEHFLYHLTLKFFMKASWVLGTLSTRLRRYTWGKERVGNGACEVRENVAHETRLTYKHVGHVI